MNRESPGHVMRVHLTVRGHVQGVGFRVFVLHQAHALGLDGMVRNLWDGGVEVEAEGTRDTLARLVSAARLGPPGAEVVGVDEAWSEGAPRYRGFRIAERA